MMNNKSIDGLAPKRTSKTASASVFTPHSIKTERKTRIAISTPASTSSHKTVPEDSLEQTRASAVTDAPKRRRFSRADITADFLSPTRTLDFISDNEDDEDPVAPVAHRAATKSSARLDANHRQTSSSPSAANSGSMRRPKARRSRGRRIASIVALVIVFLLTAGVVCFILWGNDIVARITGGRGNLMDLVFEKYEPLRTDENERINILAFGTSGYDMAGTEDGQIHDGAQLTDSILIISIDPGDGDTVMASLPRDLKVSDTCSLGKINEVYWCNNLNGDNEEAGATALMDEVSMVTGLDFEYFAHVNWGSLKAIVDALGGIKVTLDEDIADTDYTGAIYQAGVEYEINGEQAVMLARARHGTADGDFTRGASQQKILIGIKNRVLEEHLSVSDLINLAAALGDNLRTNFSVNEMKTLAHLSSTLDFSHIRQLSFLDPEPLVNTPMINGTSYVAPIAGDGNFDDIRSYFADFIANDIPRAENASILVLNATEQTGLAANEKVDLANDGYTFVDVDNYSGDSFGASYTLFALTDDAPITQAALEEKYAVTAKSADALPDDIRNDYDFILILGVEE